MPQKHDAVPSTCSKYFRIPVLPFLVTAGLVIGLILLSFQVDLGNISTSLQYKVTSSVLNNSHVAQPQQEEEKTQHELLQEGGHELLQEGGHVLLQEGSHELLQEDSHALLQEDSHVLLQEGSHELLQEDSNMSAEQSADMKIPPWNLTTNFSRRIFQLEVPTEYCDKFVNPCWYADSHLHCLPYFFLAGMPKSGTTDLFFSIFKHPQVIRARAKEFHWWTRTRLGDVSCNTKPCKQEFPGYYLTRFSTVSRALQKRLKSSPNSLPIKLVSGDCSASTFWDNHAWRRLPGNEEADEPRVLVAHHIKHYLPKAKVIVILRDPLERLFSGYLYFLKNVSATDFHQKCVQAINVMTDCLEHQSLRSCAYGAAIAKVRLAVGLYAVYLKDWLSIFPRDQIHVIQTEAYAAHRNQVMAEVFSFLQLDPVDETTMKEITKQQRHNRRKNKLRTIKMLPETRTLLREFYAPYNRQLATQLNDSRYLWSEGSS